MIFKFDSVENEDMVFNLKFSPIPNERKINETRTTTTKDETTINETTIKEGINETTTKEGINETTIKVATRSKELYWVEDNSLIVKNWVEGLD